MKQKPALSIIIACLFFIGVYPLKAQSSGASGCAVLNKSFPSLYITFERRAEDDDSLLLRLHNNLSCFVKVESAALSREQFDKTFKPIKSTEAGSTRRVDYAPDWNSKTLRLPLLYDFQMNEGLSFEPGNYNENRDQIFMLTIPSSRSIVFPVQSTHLRDGNTVAVQFYFLWDQEPRLERIIHRVVFEASELPVPAKP